MKQERIEIEIPNAVGPGAPQVTDRHTGKTILFTTASLGGGSLRVMGSNDGSSFAQIGSDISSAGFFEVDQPTSRIRIDRVSGASVGETVSMLGFDRRSGRKRSAERSATFTGIIEALSIFADMGGQSNQITSSATPALSTTPSATDLRVDANSVVALVETTQESPASAFAAFIRSKQPARAPIYISNEAVGGTAYSGLQQGTASYNASLDNLEDAVADAGGAAFVRYMTWWQHGETNEGLGTTAEQYRDNMIDLQSDKQADFRTRLGDVSLEVPLFLVQLSNESQTVTGRTRSNIALGQNMAADLNPQICEIGPAYDGTYQSNGNDIHMTNVHARRRGEYAAKAYYRWKILGGQKWQPLHIASAVAVGNEITLTYAGGDGSALVLDTTNMIRRSNYGFEYTDSSGSPAGIVSVAIDPLNARRIIITLNKDAHATGIVRYALSAGYESLVGPRGSGPGGNVRDSDAEPSLNDAVPLYNFARRDEVALSSFTPAGIVEPAFQNTQSIRSGTANGTRYFAPEFTACDGLTRCTWSFWVRRDTSWLGSELTIWARNATGSRQWDFRGTTTNAGRFYLATNATTVMNYQTPNGVFAGSTWFHVCVVFDGTAVGNARLLVYVNGVDVTVGGTAGTYSTTPPAALPTLTNRTEMSIFGGCNLIESSTHPLNMNGRDFAVWPAIAFNQSEVNECRTGNVPTDLANHSRGQPPHWWRGEGNLCDSGSAAVLAHLTGIGNPSFTAAHPGV